MDLFLEILKVIILGIVQGITEWLPVSSTGHMILVDEFIKLNSSEAFKDMFLVLVQLGSIMAVVILYFNKLNPFSPKKSKEEKKDTMNIWYKVVIATIPAAVIGLLFDDWISDNLLKYQVVAITLILYGIIFILVENKNKGKEVKISSLNDLDYHTAFLIGVFQVLALIPGTSRSGSTIIGAVILGTSRYVATEFSFFLSIPVMFGASALKLFKFGFDFKPSELIVLLIGMVVAFLVSVLAIRFLLGYIKKNDFKAFGWYRIILGVILIFYFLFLG